MESSGHTDFQRLTTERQNFAAAIENIITEAYKPYIIFLWAWLAVIQITVIIYTVILVVQRKRNSAIDQQVSEIEAAVRFHHQLCQNTVRLRNHDPSQGPQQSTHQAAYKPEFVVASLSDERDSCDKVVQTGNQIPKGSKNGHCEVANNDDIDITIERTRTVHVERICDIEDSTDCSPSYHNGDVCHPIS